MLVAVATLLIGGCGLTDLDLGGGARVTSVKVGYDTGFTLAIDGTQALELTVIYDDGFEEAAPRGDVTWFVDDPLVAAIDGNAQLRGRGMGSTGLTGRYASRTATTTVTVVDQPQALEIQASDRNCAVGELLAYGLLLRYQHGATENVTGRALWVSDQPAVATVEAGTVTGRAAGSARIHATLGTLTTSAEVFVSAAAAGAEPTTGATP